MVDQRAVEAVEVTQVDLDFASRWASFPHEHAPLAMDAARHRIAALAAARPIIMEQAAGIADEFHRKAIEWAKTVRGLEQHITETDSSRIAQAIRHAATPADPHEGGEG